MTTVKRLNEYFAMFRVAKIIQPGNVSSFTSTKFKEFISTFHIEHTKSSIYMSFSNGLIESVYKTMKESMASVSNNFLKWSGNLLNFKLHYNSSTHTANEFSPVEIFFGISLNIHLDSVNDPKFAEDFKS